MDKIQSLISKYKKLITANQLKGEVYKWELTSRYKGRPNTDAADFTQEIKELKFQNLIYQMGWAVLRHLSKDRPEDLRQLFISLFDESVSLSDRIKSFDKDSLKLYRELDGEHGHHQDERAISTYLTFHDPQKYTFYKASFYKKYCKILGVNEAGKHHRYPHFLTLIGDLIEKYIVPDEELINLVKSLIPEFYDGTNHLLLAQDILYQTLEQEVEPNYWIFQASPKVYDTVASLKDQKLKNWTVAAHKEKVHKGDKVILWITGPQAGCYALATVTSEIENRPDDEDEMKYYVGPRENLPADRVSIAIDYNLAGSPLLWSTIMEMDDFRELKVGTQGTTFSATKEQYEGFKDLVDSDDPSLYLKVKKNLDSQKVEQFLPLLRKFMKDHQLEARDERISLNVRGSKNRLAFLIGSRYAFSIEKTRGKTNFSFISPEAISPKTGPFTNQRREVEAYWNELDDITAFEQKIEDGFLSELARDNKNPFKRYENQDFVKDIFQNSVMDKTEETYMNPNQNVILYGPPGTGKTYNTLLRAASIVMKNEITDYAEAQDIFNQHLGERIGFITFHQNYSYEDFIQGLRPIVDQKDKLVFERKDGMFKQMAIDALFEYYKVLKKEKSNLESSKEKKDVNEIYLDFIEYLKADPTKVFHSSTGMPISISDFTKNDNIEFKHQNRSRTYIVSGNRLLKLYQAFTEIKQIKNINEDILNAIGGCNATIYWVALREFIEFKKLHAKEDLSEPEEQYDEVGYETKKKLLSTVDLKELRSVKTDQVPSYVLIADEINRANISRVFGELITLIEPDKRSHGAVPLRCTLPSGDDFIVPSNLYLIGTMNTADKSIALLDIALRRRFVFEPMYPLYEIEGYEIYDKDLLRKINEKIIGLKGHDFQIGHSYFMGENRDLFLRMNKKVIPLLLEYFMNDVEEVKKILLAAGLTVKEGAYPLTIIME